MERKTFSVDGEGWITQALEKVNAKEPFRISLTGESVTYVMRRVQNAVAAMPMMNLWKDVKAHLPLAGKLPIDPTMAVPVLAAIGGAGGAAGSAAFVASIGAAHGMAPTFEYNPHAWFSVTDDELLINVG